MSHHQGNGDLDRRLQSLADGPAPPPELEEATVARLRSEGHFHDLRSSNWQPALAAVLALALPLAGFFAGRWSNAPTPAPQATYALLLYGEGDDYNDPGGDTGGDHAGAEEQSHWARSPHPEGTILDGEPLMPDARILGLEAGATLADAGPLTGFFLVDAEDLEAAADLARGNPHIAAGGVIEVRPVGFPE